MTATATQIIREHVDASRRFRASVRGDAAKARAFLIKAGILHKGGKKLTKRYR
jgi:hypothetical protein